MLIKDVITIKEMTLDQAIKRLLMPDKSYAKKIKVEFK
jgi:hypothetical protein